MAAKSQAQGFQGLANAAAMGAGAIDSGKTAGAKAFDKLSASAQKQGIDLSSSIPKLGNIEGVDLSQLSGKSSFEQRAFLNALSPDTIGKIGEALKIEDKGFDWGNPFGIFGNKSK